LREGLRLLGAEGLSAVVERHQTVARLTQTGLEKLRVTLYAEQGRRSPTVTSAVPPTGVDAGEVVRLARTQERLVLGSGQGPLAGKIIRVGHLGWIEPVHIEDTLASLGRTIDAIRSKG
ncbi:MAG: alanine--glyoxylate aminotransferase family protein, partial [Chloroflexota bacterium]